LFELSGPETHESNIDAATLFTPDAVEHVQCGYWPNPLALMSDSETDESDDDAGNHEEHGNAGPGLGPSSSDEDELYAGLSAWDALGENFEVELDAIGEFPHVAK
jgi:hypothetical protein